MRPAGSLAMSVVVVVGLLSGASCAGAPGDSREGECGGAARVNGRGLEDPEELGSAWAAQVRPAFRALTASYVRALEYRQDTGKWPEVRADLSAGADPEVSEALSRLRGVRLIDKTEDRARYGVECSSLVGDSPVVIELTIHVLSSAPDAEQSRSTQER